MSTEFKYEIINKHINGITVESFTLLELSTGKKTSASYENTVILARNGKIKNATALVDITSGSYLLEVEGGIQHIDIHKPVNLILNSRILDADNKCIGYKAKDSSGKIYKLSIEKVWELASIGCVNGITAKINNGRKILISNNTVLLRELPVMKE